MRVLARAVFLLRGAALAGWAAAVHRLRRGRARCFNQDDLADHGFERAQSGADGDAFVDRHDVARGDGRGFADGRALRANMARAGPETVDGVGVR